MADQNVPNNGIFLNRVSINCKNFFPRKDKDKKPTKVINITVITISIPGIFTGK